ncbi:DNA translocase FtsK [Roseivivax marinus]|uniref:DNA translocase FtsK n=1 Tax=Roseivivax marinus TaxID=1379903 RepID=UPI00273E5835|nr:DNA translocase FtsK [Roseivivax marinus]
MAYQARGRDPLFDTDMANALERRGKELLGLALVVVGLMAAAMLGSYTPDDPSWMSATDAAIQNWMGRIGASVAAPLVMIFGAGNWILPLVLTGWGLRFVTHRGEERALGRVIFLPIWWAVASIYAAGLTAGPEWGHSFGLGGLFGDVAMGSAMGMLPFGAGFSLTLVTVLAFAGVLVVGAFVLGFTRSELSQAGRFVMLALVMAYAAVVRLLGQGASGAAQGASAMRAAHADRRARRIAEAEDDRAWAEAQEPSLGRTAAAAAPAPRVRRSARIEPEPEVEVVEDDYDDWDAAPEPAPRGGLLSRVPGLMRFGGGGDRAVVDEADDLPLPELVEEAFDEVDAPADDRVQAKIADAIRARLRATPQARVATDTPLTRGRGRRPDPLIADLSPRRQRAEPPLTAEPGTVETRREPVLTAPARAAAAEPRPQAQPVAARRASAAAPMTHVEPEDDYDIANPVEEEAFEADAPQAGRLLRRSGAPAPAEPAVPEFDDGYDDEDDDAVAAFAAAEAEAAPAPRPQVPVAPQKKVVQQAAPKPVQPSKRAQEEAEPRLQFEENAEAFELPPLSLLMNPDRIQRHHLSDEALEENARMLENVLDDYGVKGEIVSVRPGPVVTMYELEPAPGLKASRVIGLADDIARSMSALSARVSTVPGRSVIGIELPNDNREMVSFREILSSREYGDGNAKLPLALGKDIGGDPLVANLAKMPHLLIAGTTGSGKSVAINTMILSLLYKLTPEDLRLVMIDPKMLELSVYDGIPHLLSPVVTDPKKAVVALKWVVGEMEDRYRKMSKMGVRNIDGYNGRVEDALRKGEMFSRTVQTGFDDETGDPVFETEEIEPKKMPYIVVIVDEMADLMMVAGKEIEACIQRLAQMARASGIHLIMATQRPSVDVITGTIKANFPTRISFQVTSKIDSRTILGEMGAEQLLGMGDMLYMAGGAKITRCHGPFCSDEEVEEVVNHLKAFGPPAYVGGVVEGPEEEKASDIDAVLGLNTGGNTGGEDALYDQAVAIVIKDRKCSTSYIQRKLGIGYNKAARLVEQMEDENVVSSANHVGKREILVPEPQ